MEAWGSRWEVSRGTVGWTWSGTVIRPADLFSAKPNQGCRGEGRWQGGVGAQDLGPFPGQNGHHSLAARPQSRVVWRGERGGREGSHPVPPVEPGRTQKSRGAGPASLGARRQAARRVARLALALGARLTRRSPTAS